ncbi:GH3 auxin-responsive promoter [Pedobacter psychrophilus]|uniref:GH3 auxin-responsive promoter n=1 Tax=Pedobacter psychrophilus TaxID=1826909 RepID=A0A179DBG9_9SPHI|nr:GH3 auxin-responsive promoter family protein [Pedobacter psychrophilus]OAQ38264.1 GH3 auxin-responsive promoter [Pedobacter psychrophilus]
MTVIGELIKKAISVSGFITGDPNPNTAQKEVLINLLEKAKHTAFGKKYLFTEILKSENPIQKFQEIVPIHDYDKMNDDWWHYLLEGHQNVTWPGGQNYFALSSGTTSNSKHIPVTDDMLDSIRKSGIQQIMSLKNFDLPGDFFEKQILMLGSSTDLINKEDHLEGEISGISASNIPAWFKGFYKPGEEIAAIKNWDEKVKRIAEEAPNWDIGSLSGIPSWVQLMLEAVIKYHKLENIHEIWPNLQVYTSGGVAFEPYRKSFEKLLDHPIIYIDTYLASEGFLAMQRRPDVSSMALSINNGVFFEFVPFEDKNIDDKGAVKQNSEVLAFADTVENVEYVLLISTVAGAWRYMIGDTVTITNKELAEIKITGRTKHYLNVVGSQLSVHQMNSALEHLSKNHTDLCTKEFVVSAIHNENEEYIHKWLLGVEGDFNQIDRENLASELDGFLNINNKNYAVARTKALKGVEVELFEVEKFYNWSHEKKNLGGQAKIPRVLKEEEFLEFQDFLKNNIVK